MSRSSCRRTFVAIALFTIAAIAHADQTVDWSATTCINGYVRQNCTAFTPAANVPLDAVQAYAACANTNCGSVSSSFHIYAANDTTLLAASDPRVLSVPYACGGEHCLTTWYFSGANRITLSAGTTYVVRPVQASGDIVVNPSAAPYRTITFLDPPPANPPRVDLPYRQPDDTAQSTFGAGTHFQILGSGLSGTIRSARARISGSLVQFFVCEHDSPQRLRDFCGDGGAHLKSWFFNTNPTGEGTWDFTAAGTMARCNGVTNPVACSGQPLDPAKYYAIGWYSGSGDAKTISGSASDSAWRGASEAWAGTPGAVRDLAFELTIDPPATDCSTRALRQTGTLGTGPGPLGTVIGDLDGDGRRDVASVAYDSGNGTTVSIFRNTTTTATPSFAAPLVEAVRRGPEGIALADLDGDGKLDVAVSSASTSGITVLRNTSTPGALSFARTDLGGGSTIHLVVAGDVDGDSRIDLVASDNGGAAFRVFRNTSTPGAISFANPVSTFVAGFAHPIALADVDGDGRRDVVMPIHDTSRLYVFRNASTSGAIAFEAAVSVETGSRPESVDVGDIDGDGRVDFAVAHPIAGSLSIHRNTSTPGAIAIGPRIAVAVSGSPGHVALKDVDLDGRIDLLATDHANGRLLTFANRSTPGSISVLACGAVSTGLSANWSAADDLNGDAAPDVVVANHGESSLSVYANVFASAALGRAAAGADVSVTAGTTVPLQGIAECNVATPTFTWQLAAKPAASAASLANSTSLAPSLTPDRVGFYTVDLVVGCGAATIRDTVHITATGCGGSPLAIRPSSLVVTGPRQAIPLIVLGGSGNFTWSIVQNATGTSTLSSTGAGVLYTAGAGDGEDVIRVSDECGAAELRVRLSSDRRAETIAIEARPDPTNGAPSASVEATFSRAIDAAELCIDSPQPPEGACRAMTVRPNGRSASIDVAVESGTTTGLAYGRHPLAVRARTGTLWGPLKPGPELSVTPGTAILLLNGYNFERAGGHPNQWTAFRPTIPCQIKKYAFGGDCSAGGETDAEPIPPGTFGTDCRTDSSSPDPVCVVDNLDGRAQLQSEHRFDVITGEQCTVQGNVPRLAEYINARPWLQDSELILIGHSYGGMIARAYAAEHPGKVKAIITMNTPHTGVPDWRRVLGELGQFETKYRGCRMYDDAMPYFQPENARKLNEQLAQSSARPTVHTISAVQRAPSPIRLNKPRSFLTKGLFTVTTHVDVDNDDVVDLDSQSGRGIAGQNFDAEDPLRYWGIPLWGILHNDVLGKEKRWNPLFEDRVAPLLRQYYPNAPGASSDALRTDSFSPSAELPADIRLRPQVIAIASGQLTAAVPAASAEFLVNETKELIVTTTTAHANPAVTLIRPDATTVQASAVDDLTTFHFASSSRGVVTHTFVVRNPAPGTWRVSLAAPVVPAIGAAWEATAAERSSIELAVPDVATSFLTNDVLPITATVFDGAAITATLATSAGSQSVPLYDDGTRGDAVANDGTFAGSVALANAGEYDLDVVTTGTHQRTVRQSFTVAATRATISGPFVEGAPDADSDGKLDALTWSFRITTPSAGTHTISAELLAANGLVAARTTTEVVAAAAGATAVTLRFEGRDLYRAGADGPYTLANVEVTDRADATASLAARLDRAAVSAGAYWSSLAFERDAVPAATWLTPAHADVAATSTYELQWTARDGSGGATVDVFYEPRGGGEPQSIASGLAIPASGEMRTTWSLATLADGVYDVTLRIRNGEFSETFPGGSVEKVTDADGDGMGDAWETANGLSPAAAGDAVTDADSDRLANLDEYLAGTDPNVADTDGGGEGDHGEAVNGRDGRTSDDDVVTLSIAAITPAEGDIRGGEVVTIFGAGFGNAPVVTFGSTSAPSVTRLDASRLVVTTPAHARGVVDVAVSNGGAPVSSPAAFTYLCDLMPQPSATNTGTGCPGGALQLFVEMAEGSTVTWTGPNGFTSAERNPIVTALSAASAGIYTATVREGTCETTATTSVAITAAPSIAISGSATLCDGGGVSLVATAGAGVLQWTRDGGDLAGQNGTSLTATQAGTYRVRLTTTTGCVVLSAPIVLALTVPELQPASRAFVAAGGSGAFDVESHGCTWSAATDANWITITSATAPRVQFEVAANPGAQARTAVIRAGGASFQVSQSAAPQFGAPSFLTATAAGVVVQLAWEARAGVAHYEVARAGSPNAFAVIAAPATSVFHDGVSANQAYAYRVRAVDANGNASAWSPIDIATTLAFTDDPLVAGATAVRLQHLIDLRTAAAILRSAAALTSSSFAPVAARATIRASHLGEVRIAIAEARAAFGAAPFVYTNAVVTGGVIRARDVRETRDAAR
jgi:alpha/beta hydrolase fold/IPT/TIG domain/FG-GAP-like repeat